MLQGWVYEAGVVPGSSDWQRRRGATAVFFAVIALGLLGIVSLGTEVGTWYLARSAADNAADASAVAAALAVSVGASGQDAATDSASDNGYTTGGTPW